MKTLVLSASAIFVSLVACSDSSECDNARDTAMVAIGDVCKQRPSSPFCRKCFAASYHSYRVEQGNCVCRHLAYNTATCWYPIGAAAEAAAGSAIEDADRSCNEFVLPAELDVTSKDAGGDM